MKHSATPWVARAIAAGVLLIALLLVGCGPPPPTVSERLQRASELEEQRDLRGAVNELKSLLITEPDHVKARWQLGLLYVKLGDSASAFKEIDRAATLGLAGEEVTRYRLHVLLMTRQFEAVLLALQSDTLLQPDQQLEFEAQARFGLEQFEAAQALFEQLLERRPDREPARMKLALIAEQVGDLALARDYLDGLLARNDSHSYALLDRADIALRLGDIEGAAEGYNRAYDLYPGWLAAGLGKVRVALARGDSAAAESLLRPIMQRYANSSPAIYLEALVALQHNDLKRARVGAERALQGSPRNASYLLLLGAIDYVEGDYSLAQARLQQATTRGDNWSVGAQQLLAASNLGLGKPGDAAEVLQALVLSHDQDAQLQAQLANVLSLQGEFDLARHYLERASELLADGSVREAQIGVSDLGDGPGRAQVSDPFSVVPLAEVHSGAALVAMMAALKRREYSAVLQQPLPLQPDMPHQPLVLEMLGAAELGLGNRAAAQALYEQALALAPDYAAAQQALAKLLN